MSDVLWLSGASPAFRLMIATSWLAPDSCRKKQEIAMRGALDADVDWAEYLRLVVRHRTPAVSWAALQLVPEAAIPEEVKVDLRRRSDRCHMEGVRYAALLADVLKGLEGDGIDVMPMKGPVLSLELYGDVGIRHFKDLDVMVSPENILPAKVRLEQLGWRTDANFFSMSPRQWEALQCHDRHIGFVSGRPTCRLDLHWRSSWDTAQQSRLKWERSVSLPWRGQSYRTMSANDLAIYLCGHGSEHAWFRAKWLGDLARLDALGMVDWGAVMAEVRGTNHERAVGLALRLLSEAYGIAVPAASTHESVLPAFLIGKCVRGIKTEAEPEPIAPLRRLRRGIGIARYNRLLHPYQQWRQSFADLGYNREDYRVLRLPDWMFWAYVPLRPFLWVLRRVLGLEKVKAQ
jgi:hypothetical protein